MYKRKAVTQGGRRVKARVFKKRLLGRVPRGPMVHYFNRSTYANLSMNQATGFNALGQYDLAFTFRLDGVQVYCGGSFVSTQALPGYTDFTNLFDCWRIKCVDVALGFTNNSSGINVPTTGLPILSVVEDHDDVAAVAAPDYNQFHNVRTVQIGQQGGSAKDGFYHMRIYPRPQMMMYKTAVTTGFGPSEKPVWIQTLSPDIPHNGLRIGWNTYGLTTNVGIGNLVLNFKIHYEFKDQK